jgi:hypothetical protein
MKRAARSSSSWPPRRCWPRADDDDAARELADEDDQERGEDVEEPQRRRDRGELRLGAQKFSAPSAV